MDIFQMSSLLHIVFIQGQSVRARFDRQSGERIRSSAPHPDINYFLIFEYTFSRYDRRAIHSLEFV